MSLLVLSGPNIGPMTPAPLQPSWPLQGSPNSPLSSYIPPPPFGTLPSLWFLPLPVSLQQLKSPNHPQFCFIARLVPASPPRLSVVLAPAQSPTNFLPFPRVPLGLRFDPVWLETHCLVPCVGLGASFFISCYFPLFPTS